MTITPTEHKHLYDTAHDITTENHHTITQNPHHTIHAIQTIIADRITTERNRVRHIITTTTQKLLNTPTLPTLTKPQHVPNPQAPTLTTPETKHRPPQTIHDGTYITLTINPKTPPTLHKTTGTTTTYTHLLTTTNEYYATLTITTHPKKGTPTLHLTNITRTHTYHKHPTITPIGTTNYNEARALAPIIQARDAVTVALTDHLRAVRREKKKTDTPACRDALKAYMVALNACLTGGDLDTLQEGTRHALELLPSDAHIRELAQALGDILRARYMCSNESSQQEA